MSGYETLTNREKAPGNKSGKHGSGKNDEWDGCGDIRQDAGSAVRRSVVD
jgi:hypothetical protein